MADNDSRIAELLARWQAEPGSRVFVQLAEEYRRAGKLNEALKVLEAGLKRQPNYLSAKIALGRCRLETGEVDVAADIFQEVLRRDATNLVANKLLVHAYLDGGKLSKAREQLNLYGILNDRDPEIEELKQFIESGGKSKPREPDSVAEERSEEDASPFLEPVVSEAEIEAKPEAVLEPEPVVDEVLVVPPPVEAPREPSKVTLSAPMEEDVFGGLFDAQDQERYLLGLGAEGLFGAEGGPGSAPFGEVSSPTAVVEAQTEPEAVIEPEFELEPEPEPESRLEATPEAEATSPFDSPMEPSPIASDGNDLFAGLSGGPPISGTAEDDQDPVFHLPPAVPGTTSVRAPEADAHSMAEVESEAPKVVSEEAFAKAQQRVEDAAATMIMPQLSPEMVQGPSPSDSAETEPVEAEEEPPATATLGQLYLQQGHREEARKIFLRVLDREPTHPVALAALQAMDQKPAVVAPPPPSVAEAPPSSPAVPLIMDRGPVAVGPGWLTAEDLLGTEDGALVQGLTARKALLLKNYLHRLRAGGQEA